MKMPSGDSRSKVLLFEFLAFGGCPVSSQEPLPPPFKLPLASRVLFTPAHKLYRSLSDSSFYPSLLLQRTTVLTWTLKSSRTTPLFSDKMTCKHIWVLQCNWQRSQVLEVRTQTFGGLLSCWPSNKRQDSIGLGSWSLLTMTFKYCALRL